MAKIEPQIKVNGVSLSDGSTRKILGDINVLVGTDGTKSITCEFIVYAATHAALLTAWNSAKSAFNLENPRVQVWIDGTATEPIEDIYPSDGTHGGTVITKISQNPGRKQAGYTINATFMVVTQEVNVPSSAGGRLLPYAGQRGRIQLSTTYNAGRAIAKNVQGAFSTTFNSTATGPLTITSITNNSGKVRLNFAAGGPTFKEGMKAIVSGTTSYNGTWIVTATTTTTCDIDLTYSTNETGTLYIGTATTGAEHYATAYSTILTDYLGVDSDGSRNATTGLAITSEIVNASDEDQNDVSFNIDAEWMQLDISGALDDIRKLDYTIHTTQPDKWPEGEPQPTFLTVEGSYFIDKDQFASTTIHTTFQTVKNTVINAALTQTGLGSLRQITEAVTSSPGDMLVKFGMQFSTYNTDLILYSETTNIIRKLKFTEWTDSDGYSIVQTPPEPWEVMVTVTASRKGFNKVDMAKLIKAPSNTGQYKFTFIGDSDIDEKPYNLAAGTDTVYEQTYSATWRRHKFRSGGITESRPVVT